MDRGLTTAKPPLLMVSHCVPDALGTEDRTRAWQLLRLAGRTHRVFLACTTDGPVNLAQWRTVNDQIQQLAMETRPAGRTLFRRLMPHFDHAPARGALTNPALSDPINQWSSSLRFDAVICTHASLWHQARSVEARVRVCDLRSHPHPRRRRTDAHARRSHWRFPNEHPIASECDLVIVDDESRHLCDGKPYNVVELQAAIDPGYFTQNRTSPLFRRYTPGQLKVVAHCDWSHPLSSRLEAWLERRVWPAVKRSVPQATFQNTRPGSADPATTLANASIIVVPGASGAPASLSMLQAIAMRRPVVAAHPQSTPRQDMPRDGEHLILCRSEHEWTARCIELLRSAGERLRLTHNAGAFIDNHRSIEQSGQALIQALLDPASARRRPISRAA